MDRELPPFECAERPANEVDARPLPLLHAGWRSTKRVLILLLGMSVLLVGVLMIVLPGPAFVVIPAGLGILATEFLWARRVLKRLANFVPKPGRADRAPFSELSSPSGKPAAEKARPRLAESLTQRS